MTILINWRQKMSSSDSRINWRQKMSTSDDQLIIGDRKVSSSDNVGDRKLVMTGYKLETKNELQ